MAFCNEAALTNTCAFDDTVLDVDSSRCEGRFEMMFHGHHSKGIRGEREGWRMHAKQSRVALHHCVGERIHDTVADRRGSSDGDRQRSAGRRPRMRAVAAAASVDALGRAVRVARGARAAAAAHGSRLRTRAIIVATGTRESSGAIPAILQILIALVCAVAARPAAPTPAAVFTPL